MLKSLKVFVSGLLREEEGQDLVEYTLIAVLIGLGIVIALSGFSAQVDAAFNKVGSTLTSAT